MKMLINFVKDKVMTKTGIRLELEVVLVEQMRKKILILAGGFSTENEISLKTAYAVKL